ncbi:hypothetical protein L1049_008592 [Liquidambar formosana]|uniref:Sodium/calcium exchanger membrane region domain-containing protein n=1 Tax=Liquidambar formosana TaxID=63359 RepID=A0AAP0X8D4_LIQFO
MASFASVSQPKKLSLFLNTSFLFLFSVFLRTYLYPSNSNFPDQYSEELLTATISTTTPSRTLQEISMNSHGCAGLHDFTDYQSKCMYVRSQINGCRPNGYINYLQIFYCTCGPYPVLGYALLLLWLVLLFYLLGNTAADYFCSSLESLSRVLKLSPTIAGITLLSLGNGAADVFSSIVSFTRSGDGDVGLNSLLGGAFFVSSIVVGIISILISPHQISIDKPSFVRDVLFFLFSLASLLVIITIGKITLWGAICFVSIYILYVCVVSITHLSYRKKERVIHLFSISPVSSRSFFGHGQDELEEMGIPLLGYVDDEKPILVEKGSSLPDEDQKQSPRFYKFDSSSSACYYLGWFLYVMDLPLYLPRRLTIPVVSEERWSKPSAVVSVTLAPFLIAAICNSQSENVGSRATLVTFMTAGLVGLVLGNLAFVTTNKSSPPKSCLFPWLAGGFLMSVTWTYIIAEELVALLVSLGNILGISPSVLGLTVLAWGNSLSDLIGNVTMAKDGGPDGAQIAISGCYAGPMFNTLVGLGLSLVFSSWSEYPSSYTIPRDTSLYETIGFLMAGLLWALVILPKKNMRLDRILGVGLLAIYLCFLFLRLARALGLLKLHGSSFKSEGEGLLSQ